MTCALHQITVAALVAPEDADAAAPKELQLAVCWEDPGPMVVHPPRVLESEETCRGVFT